MIEVKHLHPLLRLADRLLWPVMYVLGGARKDSVQETHFWHCQRIDPREIDSSLTIQVTGDERSRVRNNRIFPFPMFHAPAFGGWRKYAVLQIAAPVPYWHVGWIHRAAPKGARPRAHVQCLPISTSAIRVLRQAEGYVTEFFAIGPSGEQLPLRSVASGELRDQRFPHVRLF